MSTLRQSKIGLESELVYVRTELGQSLYDVCFSSMSAAAAARKWKHRGITREFVLQMRHKFKKKAKP